MCGGNKMNDVLSYISRGEITGAKKPRVYFCSHPRDYELYFSSICDDLFLEKDCVIYYTDDMNRPLSEENIKVDLSSMNLFVIPITRRALSERNRAIEVDIKIAMENHIPILPILLENDIDDLYSRIFGDIQYLDKHDTSVGALSYNKKLKDYLSCVLLDDKIIAKVRAAFDAYIFLSYRKKDRLLAKQLMSIIHSIPGCRDIAIGFDEYLTPGESFNESIKVALENSDLFALLVTPNLVKEDNYIITTEYPSAKKCNKQVIPVEMDKTSSKKLKELFDGIPDTIKTDEELQKVLLSSIKNVAVSTNDDNPEHSYLIGLAYLEGIDVEINKEIAIELISKAANSGLANASQKLYDMYRRGIGVRADANKALEWAKINYNNYKKEFGATSTSALYSAVSLVESYIYLDDIESAEKICNENLAIAQDNPNCDDGAVLLMMNMLGRIYLEKLNINKALKILNDAYNTATKKYSKDIEIVLTTKNNIALCCSYSGDYIKALDYYNQIYDIECKKYGDTSPNLVLCMANLGACHCEIGNAKKGLEILEKALDICVKNYGESYWLNNNIMFSMNSAYDFLKDYNSLEENSKRLYELRKDTFGEKHTETLASLVQLGIAYHNNGKYNKAKNLFEQIISTYEEMNATQNIMYGNCCFRLGVTYCKLHKYKQAEHIYNKALLTFNKNDVEQAHLRATIVMGFWAIYYRKSNYSAALNILTQGYNDYARFVGPANQELINIKYFMAKTLKEMSLYNQSISICNQIIDTITACPDLQTISKEKCIKEIASNMFRKGNIIKGIKLYLKAKKL